MYVFICGIGTLKIAAQVYCPGLSRHTCCCVQLCLPQLLLCATLSATLPAVCDPVCHTCASTAAPLHLLSSAMFHLHLHHNNLHSTYL